MAFTSTIVGRPQAQLSGKLMSCGTWDADGTTGGDINTGLRICEMIILQPKGTYGADDAVVLNETLPCTGSAVSIGLGGDVDGYWWAFGH